VTCSFPSAIHQGNTPLGDIPTLEFNATYIQSVKRNDRGRERLPALIHSKHPAVLS
jgi:hypothetical protein